MPLNKARGNMYEFVTHTWNPIKGDCPHDCSYCYVKRIYKRFKKEQGVLRLDEKELKTNLGKGNFIFVGSSCDMFADNVSVPDVKVVIYRCCEFPDNRYLFQSKDTHYFFDWENIMPDNSVLCTTIETNRGYYPIMGHAPLPGKRAYYFAGITKEKYLTIEPIMDFDLPEFVEMIKECAPVQVNIGADSGHNNLPEPPAEKVLELIVELEKVTKVVQKPNLARLLKC